MAVSGRAVRDLEKDKFIDDDNGSVAVNSVISGGSVRAKGLSSGGRITTLTLTDGTWVKLPTTPLT